VSGCAPVDGFVGETLQLRKSDRALLGSPQERKLCACKTKDDEKIKTNQQNDG
jgi:hypothetical protein